MTDIEIPGYIKNVFKSNNQRMTAQRESILKVLFSAKGVPLGLEEIYIAVRKERGGKTSKITIKRSLDAMKELGIINELKYNGSTKYEINHKLLKTTKVMIICTNCWKVMEREIDETELTNILRNHGINIRKPLIKIYGECEECEE